MPTKTNFQENAEMLRRARLLFRELHPDPHTPPNESVVSDVIDMLISKFQGISKERIEKVAWQVAAHMPDLFEPLSPVTPSDIDGLKLWLKADADGTLVDQNEVLILTTTRKPITKTIIVNGRSVIRFS